MSYYYPETLWKHVGGGILIPETIPMHPYDRLMWIMSRNRKDKARRKLIELLIKHKTDKIETAAAELEEDKLQAYPFEEQNDELFKLLSRELKIQEWIKQLDQNFRLQLAQSRTVEEKLAVSMAALAITTAYIIAKAINGRKIKQKIHETHQKIERKIKYLWEFNVKVMEGKIEDIETSVLKSVAEAKKELDRFFESINAVRNINPMMHKKLFYGDTKVSAMVRKLERTRELVNRSVEEFTKWFRMRKEELELVRKLYMRRGLGWEAIMSRAKTREKAIARETTRTLLIGF